MNAHLAAVLGRIAAATGAIRVRAADAERLARNGGTPAELDARVRELIERLERMADELEQTLA